MKSSLFGKSLGLLFFGLVVLLADCAKKEAPKPGLPSVPVTTAKFNITQDDFEDITRYIMQGNVLPDDSTKPAQTLEEALTGQATRTIQLDAKGSKYKDGKIKYNLVLFYMGQDWLFINNQDESLLFLIDGQKVALKGGGYKSKVSQYQIMEMVAYPVEFDFLVQISKAKNVKVKLKGSSGAEIRFFAKENINNFAEFVKRFGPDEISKEQGEGPKEEKK